MRWSDDLPHDFRSLVAEWVPEPDADWHWGWMGRLLNADEWYAAEVARMAERAPA